MFRNNLDHSQKFNKQRGEWLQIWTKIKKFQEYLTEKIGTLLFVVEGQCQKPVSMGKPKGYPMLEYIYI